MSASKWERRIAKALTASEHDFLAEYDHWLKVAFSQIPIGGDEHVIHGFHLTVHQRLSAILAKHSAAALAIGQAHGAEDCKAILEAHKRKLADLPTITFTGGSDFTPHDALKVLRNRAIKLAGDVESDIVAQVKTVLLKHLTGQSRADTQQEIANLLKSNMNRASLIVTTETTYAYNRGRLLSYMDSGVDYVQFRAIMDDRTCPICSSRNGLMAPIGEIGNNTPPVHGRCRCVLSPVFSRLQGVSNTDWTNVAPLPKGWVA